MALSFRPQAMIAGAGALLLLAVLWAMGATNTAGSKATDPRAATPGSTYVEAMVGAPRFVNPLLATSDTDTDLAHLVYSGLTRVSDTGSIVPDLASGWEVSPDSKVFTFTLRTDARWQDGEPLTADDVLFTLDLLRRPDFSGDPTLAAPWKDVDISVPGQQHILFRLPTPNASFIQYTTLGILPRHAWGATVKSSDLLTSPLNQAPIGSGPWRYVRSSASGGGESGASDVGPATPVPSSAVDGVLLEPNPYAKGSTGGISRLWFRLYPTFGAALSGFKLGEVHGLGHIPAERMAEVEAIPGVQLHNATLARYTMLIFNLRAAEFDRVETRQAVELAIDRAAIVRDSVGGMAEPAYSPVLPHSWAYDPQMKSKLPYNPAEAGRLLDQAGWKMGPNGVRARDGVTLTLVLAANAELPANVAVSQQIAGALRAVGVDVKLALVSRDVLLRDYLGPRAFHMVLAGWEAQGVDPDVWAYWHSSQADMQGGLNFSGWRNPDADKALDASRAASDPATRKAAYATFQALFAADVPADVLYCPLYTYATRPPATGVSLPNTDLISPAQRFDTLAGWTVQPSRVP